MFSYFLFFFIFFWFFHFLRRFLFWLYFWQLKEYRLDRLWDGISQNPKILWLRFSFFALILILAFPFLAKNFIFESLVFSLYFLAFLYALFLFLKKKWAFPKFTLKMTFLFLFCLFCLGSLFFYLNPTLSPFIFSLEFLVLEIFFPWIFLFLFLIFQIPIFFIKKIIIFKAKKKRKLFKNLLVIGITGSYGKTSTKEFLSQILSKKFKVLKTKENQNTEMGAAKTILSGLNSNIDVFICEMGAYRKGEIKAISNLVLPKIGILTGIVEQHLSLFGSFSNLLNTKYELIASLPKDGIAIFNGKDKYCQKLASRTSLKKYFYSIEEGRFDIFARKINEKQDHLEFEVFSKITQETENFSLNLFGKQNIENFLAAGLAALLLGFSLKEIKEVEKKIESPKTTIRRIFRKEGAIILDDSYSQNPIGTIAAIEYLKNYPLKKVIVMPCLIELGKTSPFWHKKIGREIGKICDFAIITTPYFFEELKLGAMESGMQESKILFLNESLKIFQKLKPYLENQNVILIEGRVPENLKQKLGL